MPCRCIHLVGPDSFCPAVCATLHLLICNHPCNCQSSCVCCRCWPETVFKSPKLIMSSCCMAAPFQRSSLLHCPRCCSKHLLLCQVYHPKPWLHSQRWVPFSAPLCLPVSLHLLPHSQAHLLPVKLPSLHCSCAPLKRFSPLHQTPFTPLHQLPIRAFMQTSQKPLNPVHRGLTSTGAVLRLLACQSMMRGAHLHLLCQIQYSMLSWALQTHSQKRKKAQQQRAVMPDLATQMTC